MMKYYFKDREIHVLQSVIDTFESFRQKNARQHESGGILLGRIYTEKIVIEKATVPNKYDKSGRFFFERDVKVAQKIVNNYWKESSGEIIYLGEWHTHPENNPKPSFTDRKLISSMLKDTDIEIQFLIMIIVGISDYFVGIQLRKDGLTELSSDDANGC